MRTRGGGRQYDQIFARSSKGSCGKRWNPEHFGSLKKGTGLVSCDLKDLYASCSLIGVVLVGKLSCGTPRLQYLKEVGKLHATFTSRMGVCLTAEWDDTPLRFVTCTSMKMYVPLPSSLKISVESKYSTQSTPSFQPRIIIPSQISRHMTTGTLTISEPDLNKRWTDKLHVETLVYCLYKVFSTSELRELHAMFGLRRAG